MDAAEVHRALDSLGTDKRESVALAYLGGNSYRTVAGLLSLPEGTVKRRIRDGLRQLATRIDPAA
jgi:RNA polymerase sigma-70 factor (ECF subfamily)